MALRGDYYLKEMKSRRIITNVLNLFTKLKICLAILLQWPVYKGGFILMYYQYMSEEPPKGKSLSLPKNTDLAALLISFVKTYISESKMH